MARRGPMIVRALAAGLLLGACVDLSEETLYEPCAVDEDCWHTQECAHTQQEILLGLPGLCLPEGSDCNIGQQLGCMCNPADPALACLSTSLPFELAMIYPPMVCDPGTLLCVVAPPLDNTS